MTGVPPLGMADVDELSFRLDGEAEEVDGKSRCDAAG